MSADSYYRTVRKLKGARQERRVRHQMEFIYNGIDFMGRSVLDIGGGIGLHALYASALGAAKVTIIEPEGDGGYDTMISTFKNLRAAIGSSNVELIQARIQDVEMPAEGFDIVLIQDAINHFDEAACITLHRSALSWEIYAAIFEGIAALMKPGGILMMSDCSSQNVFPLLGIGNPFDPQIEWEKHQPPSVWAKVAKPHDLELTRVRWSSPTRLGALGQAVFGNAVASWFFTSHFVTTFRKKDNPPFPQREL